MERSFPFNAELVNGEYDRTYLAEDFRRYFSSFVGNGVYANPANNLQVTATGNDMQIIVKAGKAWVNGVFYENTADYPITVENADGVLNRVDSLVVRLDETNREMKLQIKKGVFASTPTTPELTRDENTHEIQLASVMVTAGAVNITQANITDTRQDAALCGIVAGVIEQIDTTNLFLQYDNAFETWFDGVKGQLSQDAAGNLLNLINTHAADTNIHVTAAEKSNFNGHIADTAVHVTAEEKEIYGNKSASAITAGTFAGMVKGDATAMAEVTTAQFRNISASTTDMTAGTTALPTGAIYLMYE